MLKRFSREMLQGDRLGKRGAESSLLRHKNGLPRRIKQFPYFTDSRSRSVAVLDAENPEAWQSF